MLKLQVLEYLFLYTSSFDAIIFSDLDCIICIR
ncbi:Hypothetical protein Minf_1097 [Methylacidiphilum infernorum V4]|uniref:Uncharacterized protein n=1 Tax=Methylacidiphilum infernorum (isolate V4) TaxID=481448 RepID=B3DUZ9_METI4|nr:Hypothetical protein Minf_1097 [Methylacidiphilum infernorum V4]